MSAINGRALSAFSMSMPDLLDAWMGKPKTSFFVSPGYKTHESSIIDSIYIYMYTYIHSLRNLLTQSEFGLTRRGHLGAACCIICRAQRRAGAPRSGCPWR